MHGSKKPKRATTAVEDKIDEALAAPLALTVHFMDVWAHRPDNTVTAFFCKGYECIKAYLSLD